MTTIDLLSPEHPLLGARAAGYPGVHSSTWHALEDHERRIGRRVHVGLAFARPGDALLRNRGEYELARRENTALVQCWKPVRRWAQAHGNTRATDKYLALSAKYVAGLGVPVMLVLHHEPENDVGQAGTARDYRRMWAHVRRVFADEGASNVVWGVAFMNYPKWDALLPDLWPAEAPPDWVWFNAYGSQSRPDWVDNVARFYNGLAERTWFDPRGACWGVREWSTKGLDEQQAVGYFDQAREAVNARLFCRLDAYMVFDSPGAEGDRGMQIGWNKDGSPAPRKQAAYRDFAHEPEFGPVVVPPGGLFVPGGGLLTGPEGVPQYDAAPHQQPQSAGEQGHEQVEGVAGFLSRLGHGAPGGIAHGVLLGRCELSATHMVSAPGVPVVAALGAGGAIPPDR